MDVAAPTLTEYVYGLFTWWVLALLTLNGAFATINRVWGLEVPRRVFIYLALGTLVAGGYTAWRNERRAHVHTGDDLRGVRNEKEQALRDLGNARVEAARLREVPEQKEMQALRDELASLKKNQADRTLTDDQRVVLVAELRKWPGTIRIYVGLSQHEPAQYAGQLLQAFKEAGWNTSGAQSTESARGLILNLSPDPTDFEKQRADFLVEAFEEAGIKVASLQRSTSVQPGELLLFVGDKPG